MRAGFGGGGDGFRRPKNCWGLGNGRLGIARSFFGAKDSTKTIPKTPCKTREGVPEAPFFGAMGSFLLLGWWLAYQLQDDPWNP